MCHSLYIWQQSIIWVCKSPPTAGSSPVLQIDVLQDCGFLPWATDRISNGWIYLILPYFSYHFTVMYIYIYIRLLLVLSYQNLCLVCLKYARNHGILEYRYARMIIFGWGLVMRNARSWCYLCYFFGSVANFYFIMK